MHFHYRIYNKKWISTTAQPRARKMLHVMVFTPRANKAHVISLRKANKREVKRYEAQA
jgi:uncharacterized DUF497 family protein